MTIDEIHEADREGLRFMVDGWRGIAFYHAGDDTEPDEDTYWSGYENPTGMVRMVMVGDDRVHIVDPLDVSAIGEDDYCHECGQIGCTGDGRAYTIPGQQLPMNGAS